MFDIYQADGLKLVGAHLHRRAAEPHGVRPPDSKTVFVSLQQTGRLVAFDLATQAIKWNVEVGKAPAGVIMLPDNKRLLVALTGEEGLVVVEPKDGTVIGNMRTGRRRTISSPKATGGTGS